jgi:hypothetical protein
MAKLAKPSAYGKSGAASKTAKKAPMDKNSETKEHKAKALRNLASVKKKRNKLAR